MKLLRNPIFTAGLVIVAIAAVFYQVIAPRLRSGRSFKFFPVAQAPVSAPAPSLAPIPQPKPPLKKPISQNPAGPGVDREYAELHFEGWVEWPQRDPFLLLTPEPEEITTSTETNSPVPSWKLKALWAQTGGRFAVINRGTYREGDEIEGYRIDKIDTGGVWFLGPHERERLGFDTRPKPASTNAPAAPKP